MNLKIYHKVVKFKLDKGSQENIYQKIQSEKSLLNTSVKLTRYSGDTIPVAGKCVLLYKDYQLELYVTAGNQPSVLEYKSCCELGLIKVTLLTEYRDVFLMLLNIQVCCLDLDV